MINITQYKEGKKPQTSVVAITAPYTNVVSFLLYIIGLLLFIFNIYTHTYIIYSTDMIVLGA